MIADVQIQIAQATRRGLDSAMMENLLSEDEWVRADAFRFPEHRRAFVWSRSLLRKILGEMLSIHPRSVRFAYEARGKPIADSDRTLHFNISHTAGLFACATSRLGAVGIDVEQVGRLGGDADLVSKNFFAPEEKAQIQSAENPRTAFYDVWTRKEAFLKATGEGLSRDPASFAISLHDDCLLWSTGAAEEEAGQWTIRSFETPVGYAGAWAFRAPKASARLTVVGATEL